MSKLSTFKLGHEGFLNNIDLKFYIQNSLKNRYKNIPKWNDFVFTDWLPKDSLLNEKNPINILVIYVEKKRKFKIFYSIQELWIFENFYNLIMV